MEPEVAGGRTTATPEPQKALPVEHDDVVVRERDVRQEALSGYRRRG